MMLPLLLAAAATLDLEVLGQAVERCDRAVASPAFAAEAGRRSQFLLDAFKEQEAIVVARLDSAARRRALRESAQRSPGDEQALGLTDSAIDDRQRALNDRRLLEGIRRETMDSLRVHFLAHCQSGRGKS